MRLKLLLWSPGGAGLHYGGPGTSAYRLYSTAAPGRFDITLAHGCSCQDQYPLFKEQALISPLRGSAWSQVQFLHRANRWLDKRYQDFDVFTGLEAFELTVGPALRAKRLGLPAVVKIAAHNSDLGSKRGLKGLLRLPERRRRRMQELDGVIAISQAIVDELRSYGFPEEKIAMIPNGVNTEVFAPVDAAARRSQRAAFGWRDIPTILFVGTVHPRKNPMVLVEALGLLKANGIECQLVIAGPDHCPNYTQAIKQRAADAGVTDRVVWHGFTRDVAPLYRASDIYALPSSGEGMPNALLEAMSSGLACIGTPISGITDLLEDGVTGRLSLAEAEPIAEALRDYVLSPEVARQHGQAARDLIEDRYSSRAILDARERLFRRIISGAPAAEIDRRSPFSPVTGANVQYSFAR